MEELAPRGISDDHSSLDTTWDPDSRHLPSLQRMYARLTDDPRFCAYHLDAYATDEGLPPQKVADWLGIALERYYMLGICLYPRPCCRRGDLQRIAAYAGTTIHLLNHVLAPR